MRPARSTDSLHTCTTKNSMSTGKRTTFQIIFVFVFVFVFLLISAFVESCATVIIVSHNRLSVLEVMFVFVFEVIFVFVYWRYVCIHIWNYVYICIGWSCRGNPVGSSESHNRVSGQKEHQKQPDHTGGLKMSSNNTNNSLEQNKRNQKMCVFLYLLVCVDFSVSAFVSFWSWNIWVNSSDQQKDIHPFYHIMFSV